MDKLQAINLFEQRTIANGTRSAYSKYSLDITPGEYKFQDKPKGIIGAMIYQANQSYGYRILGGTGPGDALHVVDGRFEYADLRTAPDYAPSPYDLKHNSQPVLITGAFNGDAARLWVNTEQVGYAAATAASKRYKNPYDINFKATKDTRFIATLTDAFNPGLLHLMVADVKQLLIDAELELVAPAIIVTTEIKHIIKAV